MLEENGDGWSTLARNAKRRLNPLPTRNETLDARVRVPGHKKSDLVGVMMQLKHSTNKRCKRQHRTEFSSVGLETRVKYKGRTKVPVRIAVFEELTH
jgi:hypothetical protein